jgi:hypothetical protein
MLPCEFNQLPQISMCLIIVFHSNQPLHLHEPHHRDICIRLRHIEIVVAIVFDEGGLNELESVEGQLVGYREEGEVVVDCEEVLSVLEKHIDEV